MSYIYQIRHSPSGKRYVGSSSRFPAMRWIQHINLLCRRGHSERFQAAWNDDSDITHWDFSVLYCGVRLSGAELHRVEASYLIAVPSDLRLNMPDTLVVSMEKHAEVKRRLREGERYVDIRDAVGVSLGTISGIRHQMPSELFV